MVTRNTVNTTSFRFKNTTAIANFLYNFCELSHTFLHAVAYCIHFDRLDKKIVMFNKFLYTQLYLVELHGGILKIFFLLSHQARGGRIS
jgi:hypothetical protein